MKRRPRRWSASRSVRPNGGFFGSTSAIGRADGTSGATLSPDGIQLVFVGTDRSGRSQLWLRRLDSLTSRPLAGTDNAFMPFWSPDSRSIGFFSDGRLKRLDVADGALQTVATVAGLPRGGELVSLQTSASDFGRWPSFLPDGRHLLYLDWSHRPGTPSILVGSTEPDFTPRAIMPNDGNAMFAPPGRLVFVKGDRLMEQPFDIERFAVSGEATLLVEQVGFNPGIGRADFSVSSNDVLAYRVTSSRQNQFAWVDRSGKLLDRGCSRQLPIAGSLA